MSDIKEALQPIDKAEPLESLHPAGQSPREAREVAVAELLRVAMSKAGTLQLTADESKALMRDFPDDAFRSGAGGKESLIYIEHSHLRDRLNETLGLGQWAVVVREQWMEQHTINTRNGRVEAMRVYVRAMLIVRGCYVAESVGDMDYFLNNPSHNFGDAFEGATTAAFRRCCKQFGIGIQAWNKAWCDGWWARKRGQQVPRSQPQSKPEPIPAPGPRDTALVGLEQVYHAAFQAKIIDKADYLDLLHNFGVEKTGELTTAQLQELTETIRDLLKERTPAMKEGR